MFCAKSAHFIAESFVRFVSFLLYYVKVLYCLFIRAVFRKNALPACRTGSTDSAFFNQND